MKRGSRSQSFLVRLTNKETLYIYQHGTDDPVDLNICKTRSRKQKAQHNVETIRA